ncbi:MAG: SRPBCC domain-containing protein [Phycisphaeraceae bacterium]
MPQPVEQPDASVRLNKLVQAAPQKVYDTWLDPETYPHWFAADPGVNCTSVQIDARVGGTMRIVMLTPGGEFVGGGEFLELQPGRRIVHTWSWENEPNFGANSTITIDLFEADNPHGDGPATEIVLTHEGLKTAHERSDHTGGWWNTLRAIGYYVRGVDAREAMYGQNAGADS